MSVDPWHTDENRRYSVGVDKGLVQIGTTTHRWPGLVNVNRAAPSGGVTKKHLDGRLMGISIPSTDYEATVEAFTYPVAFEACIGNTEPYGSGLIVHGQVPRGFDFCYRTMDGDGGGHHEDYVLHFVYGCMATEEGHDHVTINEAPEAENFMFRVYGVPVNTPLAKASSYFSVRSRDFSESRMTTLTTALWGSASVAPSLPTLAQLRSYLGR